MPSYGEPHVHIVDDDAAVRDALRELVESAGLRAALYASAEEFLATADATLAGCLLLDLRMTGLSGLELQEQLPARGIDLPVIIITGHGDVPAAVRTLKQGAVDFVQKPFDPAALLQCIRAAMDQHACRRATQERRDASAARLAVLSPREREVLMLLAQGQVNKQIAATLGIAERTVEFHRAHIMTKTGATSVLELLQLVLAAQSGVPQPQRLSDPLDQRS